MDELNQESDRKDHMETPLDESTDISFEDILQSSLAQLEHERDDYRDRMQRAQAEFINFKRRTAGENIETTRKEKARVVSILLPVVDDLDLAMNQQEKLTTEHTWATGIELIYRKLESALANEGLTAISVSPGDIFDPLLHEGLAYQAHLEYEEGQIVNILRKGYFLDNKLLRATQVSVAHKPQQDTASTTEDNE